MGEPGRGTEVIDDTDPRIRYQTTSTPWDAEPVWGVYGAHNGTLHVTREVTSDATLSFKGSYVAVSCLLLRDGSNFTATLDDVEHGPFSLTVESENQVEISVVFEQTDLDANSDHTLVLKKVEDHPDWVSPITGERTSFFNIDFIEISQTTPDDVQTPPSEPDPAPSENGNSTPIGAIVGGVVGGVVLIAAIIGFFIFQRRKKNRLSSQTEVKETFESPTTPAIRDKPTQNGKINPFIIPTDTTPSQAPLTSTTSINNMEATSSTSDPVPPVLIVPQHSSDVKRPLPTTTPPPRSLPSPPSPPQANAGSNPRSLHEGDGTQSVYSVSQPTINSSTNSSSLRQELEGLREQVRRLTEMQQQRLAEEDLTPLEPPPVYEPRRSSSSNGTD